MNKFIKEQLLHCRVPLPEWDNNTTQLIIPLYSEQMTLNTNSEFLIEIKTYIINEPPNFTLSHDWNNDTIPPESMMIVSYKDTRGKMTKVSGHGKTTNIFWEGWLPNKSFEVIE